MSQLQVDSVISPAPPSSALTTTARRLLASSPASALTICIRKLPACDGSLEQSGAPGSSLDSGSQNTENP